MTAGYSVINEETVVGDGKDTRVKGGASLGHEKLWSTKRWVSSPQCEQLGRTARETIVSGRLLSLVWKGLCMNK